MTDSLVSVVVALYNGADTIEAQLDALTLQSATGFEVIVADNGSTDLGPKIVIAHTVGAHLVDASNIRGQGHARNVGASVANGDLLLFCDQDDIVSPEWVEAMRAALGYRHLP